MKLISLIIGVILIVIATLATPCAIIYGIYQWGALDMPIQHAAWEAAKYWIISVIMYFPGVVFLAYGKD